MSSKDEITLPLKDEKNNSEKESKTYKNRDEYKQWIKNRDEYINERLKEDDVPIQKSQKCHMCNSYLMGCDELEEDPDYYNWIVHKKCLIVDDEPKLKKQKK